MGVLPSGSHPEVTSDDDRRPPCASRSSSRRRSECSTCAPGGHRRGRAVDLSAREFALAETFLRHPGQVLSREQLLSHVWGYDVDPGSNVVDGYVRYLRRKLGAERILTVRGMGHRLDEPP